MRIIRSGRAGPGASLMGALGLTAAVFVAGCDEGPKGRPLNYEPGVYKGEPDRPLTEQTLEALRDRARHQQADFATTGTPMVPLARERAARPLATAEGDAASGGGPQSSAGGEAPQDEGRSSATTEAGKPKVGASDEALRERARRQSLQ